MDSNKRLKTSSMSELSVESMNCDQKYSRDSFDRFGDDLCELLLSYLTFKDKIVFEDVCRQWKRTIYNRQKVLRVFSVHPIEAIPHLMNYYLNELMVPIKIKNFVTGFAYNQNMRTIDVKRLKNLLNKCKDIKKIELTRVYIDGPLLQLIGQMCPNLQSIQLDLIGLEEEDIISFGQKCGSNLQQIRFNNTRVVLSARDYSHKFCAEFGRKMLSFCTNIKSFQCEDITLVNERKVEFLPKLESIELKLKRNDSTNFRRFIDKYENRLKKLKLSSSEVEFQTLRNTMEQMSRLKNIEDLNISFNLMLHNNGNPNTINDKLTEMAKNCPKLMRFHLNFNIFVSDTEFMSGTIWECLGKFVNLRQLYVTFRLLQIDETVETLKRLKHLTHLSIKCSKMGDPFFKDVDLFLPHLKSLQLYSDYDLSDTLIESLSKLKNLTKISLGNGNKALRFITDLGISKLLENCPQLRRIVFLSRPNITTKTVDNLIEFANKNSKNNISFFCGFSRNGDESLFAPIDLSAYTNIPNNLRIIIRTVNPNFNMAMGMGMAGLGLGPHIMPINDLALNQDIHVIEFNIDNPVPNQLGMPGPLNNIHPDIQFVFHNHPPNPLLFPPININVPNLPNFLL